MWRMCRHHQVRRAKAGTQPTDSLGSKTKAFKESDLFSGIKEEFFTFITNSFNLRGKLKQKQKRVEN